MFLSSRRLVVLATLGSIALLGGAFVFQALGYAPCHLCLLQRWPHGAAIVIGLVALLTGLRFWPWLGALAAATTSGLGIYHTGVEQHWWVGPTTCTSGPVGGMTAAELLDKINAAPLVQCDVAAWSLFHVSMASWNAIFSAVLVLLWLAAALRKPD